MRWIGQNIFDLKSRFKDDVVIEKTIVTSSGTTITPQSANNGDVIVGGATPAAVTGADLAGTGLSATVGDGTLVLDVEVGISDGNILAANDVVADDDFLRIDGTEVEGLTVAEVLTALNVEAGADVTDAGNVTTAGAVMDSEVTNLALVKGLTAGISDTNVLTANDVVADDDFLRIDGTEVEGLSASEVLTALGVEAGATADQSKSDIEGLAIQTVGAITSGSWTSTDIGVAYGGTGASNSDAWLNSRITTNNDGTLNYDATGATAVNHDNLAGFVTEEHVDWAASGAGTIHTDNYVENVVQTTVTGSSGSCTGNAATATSAATVTGATQSAITSIGTDGDTLNILADDVIMSNSTGWKTALSLVNTTNSSVAPIFTLRNDRDGNGLTDDDTCGYINFDGDDAAGGTESYAQITVMAKETAHGDECGQFKVNVANNGANINSLIIEGNKATTGEVNVDIGAGDACIVETPGVFEAKGFHTNQVTLTATNDSGSPGGTAIPAGYSVIEVAAGSAATDKLTLPPAVQGSSLRIINADGTAFELETSNPSTIFINGGTGGTGESSTVSGWSFVDCVCFGSNRWTCTKTMGTTGVQTPLEDSH